MATRAIARDLMGPLGTRIIDLRLLLFSKRRYSPKGIYMLMSGFNITLCPFKAVRIPTTQALIYLSEGPRLGSNLGPSRGFRILCFRFLVMEGIIVCNS